MVVQTTGDEDDEIFLQSHNVTLMEKRGCETEISLEGRELGSFVQVMAADTEDRLLGYSEVIDAETRLYISGKSLPGPEVVGLQNVQLVFLSVVAGVIGGCVLVWTLRGVVCAVGGAQRHR